MCELSWADLGNTVAFPIGVLVTDNDITNNGSGILERNALTKLVFEILKPYELETLQKYHPSCCAFIGENFRWGNVSFGSRRKIVEFRDLNRQ